MPNNTVHANQILRKYNLLCLCQNSNNVLLFVVSSVRNLGFGFDIAFQFGTPIKEGLWWLLTKLHALRHLRKYLTHEAAILACIPLVDSPSEAGVRSPARPQVGKLVVACRWSAVYSTEP